MDYKKIKTFEDACTAKGISATLPDVSAFPEKHRKAILAFFMLTIVVEALNDGWEPNWNDEYEYKYYPWFDMRSAAGSGFSASLCGRVGTITTVGSRLCFKTREHAQHTAKHFEALYKDYLLM